MDQKIPQEVNFSIAANWDTDLHISRLTHRHARSQNLVCLYRGISSSAEHYTYNTHANWKRFCLFDALKSKDFNYSQIWDFFLSKDAVYIGNKAAYYVLGKQQEIITQCLNVWTKVPVRPLGDILLAKPFKRRSPSRFINWRRSQR